MALLVRAGSVPAGGFRFGHFRGSKLLTEKLEVVLDAVKLVETYVCLDGNARTRVAEVGIVARNDRETFAIRFPRELGDGVCGTKDVNVVSRSSRRALPLSSTTSTG